jgi:hypothetical protein
MESELWPIFGGRESFEEAPADVVELHIIAWTARKEAERILHERNEQEQARQQRDLKRTRR